MNIEVTAKIADAKFIMTVLGVVVVVSFDIIINAPHVSFSFLLKNQYVPGLSVS